MDYEAALGIQMQLGADFPKTTGSAKRRGGHVWDLRLGQTAAAGGSAATSGRSQGQPPRNPNYRQFYRNHLRVLT